jgi:hypothetical protein
MSKDLALENSEAMQQWENENTIIIEPQEENSEYIELMKRLQTKTEPLSYSSLKAFAKSPRNFIQYKLKPRSPQTESQIFGSLCDAFLTTPDKVDEMFVFIRSFPTSENQVGFCNDMISGKSKEDAYANNYKTGGVDKVYEAVGNYVEAVLSGKLVCTQKMYDEAFKIVENLKKSELVMQYIDSCTYFQTKREWEYNGWKFKGFTDAEGTNIIIDFKFTKDADPDKFERDIVNFHYFMQMGMYTESDGSAPECYFIVYDKSLNFSVIKLDFSFISYGIRNYKYLVAKLEDCIKNNRWKESYNFWDVQQRTCYKPKWIKGFETDAIEIE